MDKKIKLDISSSILESSFDAAKKFLNKLIGPSVEEAGLLIKDHITSWRFKNQLRILNKASEYCIKHNITPKSISLKLLCPLIENASLEENEFLQDKWSILLANMVDSEQNIQNHVFPYILSQLSSNEFLILDKVFEDKQKRNQEYTKQLEELKSNKAQIEPGIIQKIKEIDDELGKMKLNTKEENFERRWELQTTKGNYQNQLASLSRNEIILHNKINKPGTIPSDSIKEFELLNLIRLGLVKEIKDFYTNPQTLEIPNGNDMYLSVKLDIDVSSEIENILTELGELFIAACKAKSSN